MKEEKFDEKLLKAVYDILSPLQNRGMVTVVFRFQVGDLINEDEDDVLLDIEESLINDGWIEQDNHSRLLRATDKLRDLKNK
jgi:NADPH-dependent glutamate synthase beta subunit-like oxidoreductase